MSNLSEIEHRHVRDRWLDAFFIVVAALLIGLSVTALTSRVADAPTRNAWSVTVVESPVEVGK